MLLGGGKGFKKTIDVDTGKGDICIQVVTERKWVYNKVL